MKETGHCACAINTNCKEYVPPGELSGHAWKKHGNEYWNDHGVEWTDKVHREGKGIMEWAVKGFKG